MSKQSNIPPLDAITIDFMDRKFPEACPNPNDTEREIWMKAGARRAVMQMKGHLKIQEGEEE